jgi:hypothetical protein
VFKGRKDWMTMALDFDFQELPLSRESKKLSFFCIYDGFYNCS